MDAQKQGADALFILLGAIMVLAMHAGFAFLELGTVRKKNQVNALVKILVDFCVSTVAYFLVGYGVAYGASFLVGADTLADKNGYELVKFFFLLTFAAAIPAIISGGIAERAKFGPQLIATAVIVGFVYPIFEGIAWNQHWGYRTSMAWKKSVKVRSPTMLYPPLVAPQRTTPQADRIQKQSSVTAAVVGALIVLGRVPLLTLGSRQKRMLLLIGTLIGLQSQCLYSSVARLPVALALITSPPRRNRQAPACWSVG